MRRSLTAVLVSVGILTSVPPAHALSHLWSHSYGSTSAQNITSVATDLDGNVYATGYFYDTINFGGGVRASVGGSDIFVVKFDTDGVRVWDLVFGDASDTQVAYGVGVDASGNVYISGYFAGAVNFGGGVLTSAGDRDLFLAKFNTTGAHQWSKRFGDAAEQWSTGLTVDDSGNSHIVGYFQGSVNFGGAALTSAGSYDAFLAAFDPAGAHRWSKKFGDASDQRAMDVATDNWGNVFVGLNFTGTVNMGGGDLTSAGGYDIGVGQFGFAGGYQWCNRYGDAATQTVAAFATDPHNGFLYFTGSLNGTTDFGGGALTSAGGSDVYLAKIDCFGAHLWSDSWGDAANQSGTAVAPDASGGVVLAGILEGTMNIGGGLLVSAGNQDIFVSWFTMTGVHSQSRRFGDPLKFQEPNALAVDIAYNVSMGGIYQGTINFGGGPLVGNNTDAFLTKFSESVTDADDTPAASQLAISAYPNPFNPTTTIRYTVPAPGRVSVAVYDMRGVRVTTLIDQTHDAGTHTTTWNAHDDRGRMVASGVYFVRVEHASGSRFEKMVLLK